MLFAAGAGQYVIATVEYSDVPAAARRVPRIGDGIAVDMERVVALLRAHGACTLVDVRSHPYSRWAPQ
jgi:precorrin-6x reductase